MKPRRMRKASLLKGKESIAPGDAKPAPSEGEIVQPSEWEFEEPAATEDREDPGANVAPTRYDTPPNPHAPVRRSSLEACGPPDEDTPRPTDNGEAP
jgi:hypothetical protein